MSSLILTSYPGVGCILGSMSEWKEPDPLGIYVTGVVGRAMGSGAFKVEEIESLTSKAIEVYLKLLEPLRAPRPTSPAPPAPSRHLPATSPPHPAYGQNPPRPQEVSLETSFPTWEHERIGLGKKPSPLGKPWGEVTWSEAHSLAASGNADTSRYLSWIAEKYEVKPDRWAEANRKMKRRATSVLAMARNGSRPAPAEPMEETPF